MQREGRRRGGGKQEVVERGDEQAVGDRKAVRETVTQAVGEVVKER